MPLDREQLQNARIIFSVGRRMGMSNRDIQIGLITAMQESSLRNLNYGHLDSLGLFQQRPSQGWGSPAQVTDPQYAAQKFFSTLKGVQGRENMAMTEAAQAVQRSAYPDAYAAHIPLIREIWPQITDSAPVRAGSPDRTGRETEPEEEEPQFELPQMVPSAATMMGPTISPMMSAPDVFNPSAAGMVEPEDWLPIISPSSFETITEGNATGDWSVPFGKGVDGWRKAVIQAAKTALGTPYEWGGDSLQEGVDCSGLIQQAFARAGIDLPRISYQQANSGQRIGLKGLKPGDLVAWDNSSRNNGADHIALYVGNGRVIEAAKPGTSVRIRKLGNNEGAYGVRMNG